MRRMWDIYFTIARIAVIQQLQYPVASYFYMIGMIAEPVIYLVVWSTVANAQGGQVGGYTAGQFAAYYIVWTLVRNMNIVFTPFGWEERIRKGQLAADLIKPLHPLHRDVAYFAGWKVVIILLWLPIAAFLAWVFKPDFQPSVLDVIVFLIAIWGAYLMRTMLLSLLGLITFWTTRVSAIFDLYFAVELLLSGRLVPLSLMPSWVQTISTYLPFRYAFGYPIEALVGNLPIEQLLLGLAMQVIWIVAGALVVRLVWNSAVKQFTSVGN